MHDPIGHKTAILLFGYSELKTARTKSLASGWQNNRAIAKVLITHIKHEIASTSIPWFHIDETIQIGHDFAERLNNAIHTIVDKGFNNVIVVGTDCPDLSRRDLLLAKQNVESGKLVIGPDKRGGIYLLAITRHHLQKINLTRHPWMTSSLFVTLKNVAHKKGIECYDLSTKFDLNGQSDVHDSLKTSTVLRNIWFDIVKSSRIVHNHLHTFFDLLSFSNNEWRGPPVRGTI